MEFYEKTQIGILFSEITDVLASFLGRDAARQSALLLITHLYGVSRSEVLVFREREVTRRPKQELDAIERLKKNEPIDYIIGKREFFGRLFEINPAVLIPRPETEELVRHVVDRHNGKCLDILDIGTGSGAIALSLGLELPGSRIEALDISSKALETAKRNADRLGVEGVKFTECDILSCSRLVGKYDVVVSNPPYVLESEKSQMKENVLGYEPHLALFVPDHRPLLFYEKIAELAFDALNPGGAIYFEINERFGEQTCEMLTAKGFGATKVILDLFDKPRIVTAEK